MADFFCTFLDSRSFTSFSLFIPPKPFSTALPILPFHNPTATGRRRKLLNLTMPCKPISPTPSLPDFDLISTSECPDGSVVFRFGDPNEIDSKEELDEPYFKDNVVEVLDGDHEREVIVKTIVKEVTSSSPTEIASSDKGLDVGEVKSVDEKVSDVVDGVGDHLGEVIIKTIEQEVISNSSTYILNSEKELDVSGEGENVNEKEIEAVDVVGDSQLELSERSQEVSQEGEIRVCVSDIDMNDSSSSVLYSDKVDTRDGSLEKDKNESSSSITVSVVEGSLRIENDGASGKALEENSGVESNDSFKQSDSGRHVSAVEVLQIDVCEQSNQEHVSNEDAGTKKNAHADSIEIPSVEAVIPEEKAPFSDLEEESGDGTVELNSQTSVNGYSCHLALYNYHSLQ